MLGRIPQGKARSEDSTRRLVIRADNTITCDGVALDPDDQFVGVEQDYILVLVMLFPGMLDPALPGSQSSDPLIDELVAAMETPSESIDTATPDTDAEPPNTDTALTQLVDPKQPVFDVNARALWERIGDDAGLGFWVWMTSNVKRLALKPNVDYVVNNGTARLTYEAASQICLSDGSTYAAEDVRLEIISAV
jgi:hypothetical protein